MSTTTSTSQGGVGFLGLLFIILLTLKITGVAVISWFWVFFPLLLVPVFILVFIAVVFIIAVIVATLS